jgi:hypothetical protein
MPERRRRSPAETKMADTELDGTLRTTQIAKLTLAAVTLLLAFTVPISQQRLRAAREELDRWPRSTIAVEKAIAEELQRAPTDKDEPNTRPRDPRVWGVDVPRTLTPEWIRNHLTPAGLLRVAIGAPKSGEAVERKPKRQCRGQREQPTRPPLPECAKGQDAPQELGAEVLCAAAALSATKDNEVPFAGATVRGTAAHAIVTLDQVRFVEITPNSGLEKRVEHDLTAFLTARATLSQRRSERIESCGNAERQMRDYSAADEKAKQASNHCAGLSGAQQRARETADQAWSKVEALQQELLVRSDEIAKLVDARDGGRELVAAVFVNGPRRFLGAGEPAREYCRLRPAVSESSPPVVLRCGPECEGDTDEDLGLKGEGGWNQDVVLKSGTWAEIQALDMPQARAQLNDKASSAELRGQIMGIDLGARDALRSAWVPLGGLLVYSLWLLWARLRAEETSDASGWPTGLVSQSLFFGTGAFALGVSVCCTLAGENAYPPTSSNHLLVCAVAIALAVFALWYGTRLRRSPPQPGEQVQPNGPPAELRAASSLTGVEPHGDD